MGTQIRKYQKNVSKLHIKDACGCALKDIDTAKDGASTVIIQVGRISDGLGQSLQQAIITAKYIERLANNKKSQDACNALGEAIKVITLSTKEIHKCQEQFRDLTNTGVCNSAAEIAKLCPKDVSIFSLFFYVNFILVRPEGKRRTTEEFNFHKILRIRHIPTRFYTDIYCYRLATKYFSITLNWYLNYMGQRMVLKNAKPALLRIC